VNALVCVITGGRPSLDERVTRTHFESLHAAGFEHIEWVLREDHVDAYERDEHALNVYPLDFANSYARAHWRHPNAFEPNGFMGAFAGREWAMRTAEQRDFDFVLQLDDNVKRLGLLNADRPAYRAALDGGSMLALLVDFAKCTNAAVLGAQLSSVPPDRVKTIRTGYPYSVFVERVAGRMSYFGPFEDDIMHALDYALYGGPDRTAALVEAMRYTKDSRSMTGMRKHYDAQRGVEIARRYPRNVQLRVTRRTSSVSDKSKGVRHILNTRGFTPVRITDAELFADAERRLHAAVREAVALRRRHDRAKIRERAGR
jgi:hypothetical protein